MSTVGLSPLSQTTNPGIQLPEEPGRHASPPAAHATVPPGLQLYHLLPPQ